MRDSIVSRIEFATALANEAGALAQDYYRSLGELTAQSKGPQDAVSEADREVEAMIRAALMKNFPNDAFVGEESGSSVAGKDDPIWVVDPIDGTQCFLSAIPSWCVSIGLIVDGRIVGGVIRDPNADETFVGMLGKDARCNGRVMRPRDVTDFTDGLTEVGWSPRIPAAPTARLIENLLERGGIYRRSGSGALGLAYVADGRYLGYFEGHMNVWDSCAGAALVSAAGGWVNDILADKGLEQGSLVAASGAPLAAGLRALAGEVGYVL